MSDPYALPAFIVALVGLIIAIFAAATGVASLAWQISTRRRGAHRIVVTARPSLVLLSNESASEWQVCVTAANIGASPVTVNGWGLRMPNKRGSLIQTQRDPYGTPLPHVLDPGTSLSVFLPQKNVQTALAKHAPNLKPRQLRAYVQLATGQVVCAKRGIPA